MSMFDPVNYGDSFIRGFTGMADVFLRKQQMDNEQRRQDSADTRADRTLDIQESSAKSQNAFHDAQTSKLQRDEKNEKNFAEWLPLADTDPIDMTPEQLQKAKPLIAYQLKKTPGLPNNIPDIPQYEQATTVFSNGLQQLQSINLKPNSVVSINRGDVLGGFDTTPIFEAHDRLLSGERFTPHKDDSGNITGTPGSQYRPYETGQFFGYTDENGKVYAYTPAYHIEDVSDGAQWANDDKRQTPIIVNDQGQPITVPSTLGHTNDPNDPIKQIPIQAQQMRLGYNLNVMSHAKKVAQIDPEWAVEMMTSGKTIDSETTKKNVRDALIAATGVKGVDKVVDDQLKTAAEQRKLDIKNKQNQAMGEALQKTLDDYSAREIDSTAFQTKVMQTLIASGADVKDATAAAKALREKPEQYKTARIDVGNGREQTVLYNISDPKDITYIGKPGPKWNTKSSDNDKTLTLTRRDISVRLRDAQRGYSAALQNGDPDKIAAAVDLIGALNEDAKSYGVPTLPVPQRPTTSDEGAALRGQAIANLKANRGLVGKFFNTDPSAAEINAEMQRLKGGTTGQPPQQSQNGRPQPRPSADSFFAQQDAASTMPAAAHHSGRTIRDTVTGRRYRSDGQSWQEVR